jgi:hypothetical protein
LKLAKVITPSGSLTISKLAEHDGFPLLPEFKLTELPMITDTNKAQGECTCYELGHKANATDVFMCPIHGIKGEGKGQGEQKEESPDAYYHETNYSYKVYRITVKDNKNGTCSFDVSKNGNTVAFGSVAANMEKTAKIAEAAGDNLEFLF